MSSPRIHFIGPLSWHDGRWKTIQRGNTPSCGRVTGLGTTTREDVTCKACCVNIAKASARVEMVDPEPGLVADWDRCLP